MNGSSMIAAERYRQRKQLGWTIEHDMEHEDGTLIDAATTYLLLAHRYPELPFGRYAPEFWPWEMGERWRKLVLKPQIEKLVQAGALIAAEIDRIQALAPDLTAESGGA